MNEATVKICALGMAPEGTTYKLLDGRNKEVFVKRTTTKAISQLELVIPGFLVGKYKNYVLSIEAPNRSAWSQAIELDGVSNVFVFGFRLAPTDKNYYHYIGNPMPLTTYKMDTKQLSKLRATHYPKELSKLEKARSHPLGPGH